jgi:RNA polymerase sigma-70 factor, ECF subfamily
LAEPTGGDSDARRARISGRSDDAALAGAAAAGDRHALEILLDRHADRVHAICRRVVAHPEDALDATQEALIAIARGIGRFDGRAAFTTWMYRVATNAALDELRRRNRRPLPLDPDSTPEAAITGVAGTDPPGPGSSGSRAEDAVDARLDVDRALATVPEEFRTAVVLRDLADLDYPEIAEVLDVPVGTVKSRIARGRAALKAALGNQTAPVERPRGSA